MDVHSGLEDGSRSREAFFRYNLILHPLGTSKWKLEELWKGCDGCTCGGAGTALKFPIGLNLDFPARSKATDEAYVPTRTFLV